MRNYWFITILFMLLAVMVQAQEDSVNTAPPRNLKFEEAKNYSTGYEYYKNKMYSEAIEPLKKVVEINPKKMAAWRYLAFSYQQLQQKYQEENNMDLAAAYLDSAKTTYYQGIVVDSTYDYFFQMLGFIYLTTGDMDSARFMYESVVELDRAAQLKDEQVRFKARKILGDIAFKEEDMDMAYEWYSEAAEIDPNDAEVSKRIEEIAKNMGDLDKVIEQIIVQLGNKPNDSTLMLKLGRNYLKNMQYDSAAAVFERLAKVTPENDKNLVLWAKSYQMMDDNNKAINVFKKILNLNGKNKEALAEIALCYANIDQIENAQRSICRALATYPRYNRAIWIKGEIIERIASTKLDKNGNISYEGKFIYEKAMEVFKQISSDPEMGRNAANRVKYLKQFERTKEDTFMHKGEAEPSFDFGC